MHIDRYNYFVSLLQSLFKDKVDYTGRPCWKHCQRVFEICSITMTSRGYNMLHIFENNEYDDVIITALFHDVLEDIPDGERKLCDSLNFHEIKNIKRIRMLTKPDIVPYISYIKGIIYDNDWITILVKFSDMLDHIERLPFIKDNETRERLTRKYLVPLKLLREAVTVRLNYLPCNAGHQYILPPQQSLDPEIEKAFENGLGQFAEYGFEDEGK